MLCTICHLPIILIPSASERAKKFGGKPSDYTNLFTEHSACALARREQETRELMARRRNASIAAPLGLAVAPERSRMKPVQRLGTGTAVMQLLTIPAN